MNLTESGQARVRQARQEDIMEIANHMRKSDVEEVFASHHYTPQEAVEKSFNDSVVCLTVEWCGKAVAIFGVVPFTFLGSSGSIWLLATDNFCKISKRFLRRSRAYIKGMLSLYPYLCNYTDVRNEASLKWLRFCGCKFGDVIPYGVEQKPFMFFEFKRS